MDDCVPKTKGEKMKERCDSIFQPLDSRCILAKGHFGTHMYPNGLLKKERPHFWQELRDQEGPCGPGVLSALAQSERAKRQ